MIYQKQAFVQGLPIIVKQGEHPQQKTIEISASNLFGTLNKDHRHSVAHAHVPQQFSPAKVFKQTNLFDNKLESIYATPQMTRPSEKFPALKQNLPDTNLL